MRARPAMARGPLGLATLLASSVAATFACGGGHGGGFTPDAPPLDASTPAFGNEAGAPCSGLACQAVRDDCAKQGKPPTTLSGKVYDPAGALPLYDVFVGNGGPTSDASLLASNPASRLRHGGAARGARHARHLGQSRRRVRRDRRRGDRSRR